MKKHGGQAFPMHERDDALGGMSLRDYFAGQALSGICSCASDNGTPRTTPEWAAALAYEVADAMLAKREEKP